MSELRLNTVTDKDTDKSVNVDALHYQNAKLVRNLGAWKPGLVFENKTDYSTYNDQAIVARGGTPLPYTTQGSDPADGPDEGLVIPFTEVARNGLVTVREDLLGPGTQLYMGDDGESVKVGDTVPAGTTHLRVDVGGEPTLLVAWDELILPATIITTPSEMNEKRGWYVVTDRGTVEFVDKETDKLRQNQNLLGWIPPGATNHSASMTAALNDFDTIYLCDGTYRIGEVNIPEGKSLIGKSMLSAVAQGVVIEPDNTDSYLFSLERGASIKGMLFHEPNQVYTMTSDYINESFNDTALPIKINTAAYCSCEDLTFIGFKKFVGQDDLGTSNNISAASFKNIRGFALEVAFDIRRSLDVLKYENIHLNLNSYRSFGYMTVDSWYYTKCALQSVVFRHARVDDSQATNIFVFGVKRLIDIVKDGYTGDSNSGGGFNITNFGVDVCSQVISCARSDAAFGYHLSNGWATPIVKPLDSSAQVSALVTGDAESNEIFFSNYSQFGNSTNPSIHQPRSGLADDFVRLGSSTQYNRVMTANCQCIQITGKIFNDFGVSAYPLNNTIHGDEVIKAHQHTKNINDLDGNPAIGIKDKSILTYGIHNNDISASEGIASGTFIATEGSVTDVNVASKVLGSTCLFTKVGSIVSVSGTLAVTPISDSTLTVTSIAIPVPFSAGAGYGSGGVYNKSVGVYVEKSTSDITLSFISEGTSTHNILFSFQYTIV